jgi:hypothetical protein
VGRAVGAGDKCDGRLVLTTCTGDDSEEGCEALRATSSQALINRVAVLQTAVHLRNGTGWRRGWNLENLLCVTRTRVPYIASTTLVHRNIVNIVISNAHFLLSTLSPHKNAAIKPALQLDPV